jgi:hypothetical protein
MFIFLTRLGRLLVGAVAVVAVTSIIGFNTLTTVPVASHHNGGTTSSGLTLVLVNSTDGLPHWGQQVTFSVSTTATSYPYVSLNCYQNNSLVYSASAGFFPSYPWPGSQIMPLSSPTWTSGAASCTAALWYQSGKRDLTISTLTFKVYA